MEDSVQDVFFTNLLLLGLKPDAMELKYKTPFNRDMFVSPNKKGMEAIFHFLFTALSPQQAKEEFKFCWPIMDVKQEAVFKKAITTWLTRLEKDEPECKLPKLGPALSAPTANRYFPRAVPCCFLNSSHPGYKFCLLLASFSAFVLRKRMTADCGAFAQIPKITLNMAAQPALYEKIVRAHSTRLASRFVRNAQRTVAAQTAWREYASALTNDCRRADQQYRDVIRNMRTQRVPENLDEPYSMEMAAAQRAPAVAFVRGVWERIDRFVEMSTAERSILQAIVGKEANKVPLDAASIPLRIPDMILAAWEREVQKEKLVDAYHGGKLQLDSFVKIWNLALQLLLDHVHRGVLPRGAALSACVETLVHSHAATAAQARALRSSITTSLAPSLQESVSTLRAQLSSYVQAPTAPLQVFPPTPKLVFTTGSPAAHQGPSRAAPTAATPDAVSAITRSVLRAARAGVRQPSVAAPKPRPVPSSDPARPSAPSSAAPAKVAPSSKPVTTRSSSLVRSETAARPAAKPDAPASAVPRATTRRPAQPGKGPAISILAQQVADMYVAEGGQESAGSPQLQAAHDVLAALGQDAFVHRSKLAHTPLATRTRPGAGPAPAAAPALDLVNEALETPSEATPIIFQPRITMSGPFPSSTRASSGTTPLDSPPLQFRTTRAAPAAALSPVFAPEESPSHAAPPRAPAAQAKDGRTLKVPAPAAAPQREPSPTPWEHCTTSGPPGFSSIAVGAEDDGQWLNASAHLSPSSPADPAAEHSDDSHTSYTLNVPDDDDHPNLLSGLAAAQFLDTSGTGKPSESAADDSMWGSAAAAPSSTAAAHEQSMREPSPLPSTLSTSQSLRQGVAAFTLGSPSFEDIISVKGHSETPAASALSQPASTMASSVASSAFPSTRKFTLDASQAYESSAPPSASAAPSRSLLDHTPAPFHLSAAPTPSDSWPHPHPLENADIASYSADYAEASPAPSASDPDWPHPHPLAQSFHAKTTLSSVSSTPPLHAAAPSAAPTPSLGDLVGGGQAWDLLGSRRKRVSFMEATVVDDSFTSTFDSEPAIRTPVRSLPRGFAAPVHPVVTPSPGGAADSPQLPDLALDTASPPTLNNSTASVAYATSLSPPEGLQEGSPAAAMGSAEGQGLAALKARLARLRSSTSLSAPSSVGSADAPTPAALTPAAATLSMDFSLLHADDNASPAPFSLGNVPGSVARDLGSPNLILQGNKSLLSLYSPM